MKRILVILGGGRPKGNTRQLADAFIQGAVDAGHEVELVSLNQVEVKSCIGCNTCRYGKPYVINLVYRLTVFQPVDNFLYVCSLQRITFNIHIDHAGLYFFKCTPRSVKRNQRNIASRPGRLSGRTNCLDCTKRHIIILRYNHINIFIFLQIFFHHFSAFCRGKISIIGIQNFPVRMRLCNLCKPFCAP